MILFVWKEMSLYEAISYKLFPFQFSNFAREKDFMCVVKRKLCVYAKKKDFVIILLPLTILNSSTH